MPEEPVLPSLSLEEECFAHDMAMRIHRECIRRSNELFRPVVLQRIVNLVLRASEAPPGSRYEVGITFIAAPDKE